MTRIWEEPELQKALVLARLASWPEARLCCRPEPSAWCSLDVLSHLLNVESSISNAIQSNLPDGSPVTIKDKARAFVVINVMYSPIRVKVPPGAKASLPKPESLTEMSAQWSDIRVNLHALLTALPPQVEKRGFFRHPVAGWMTVPAALTFLSAHLKHHGYQLDRLERVGTRSIV